MKTTTMKNIGNTQRNVGIDVGKNLLDIFIYETGDYWQADNSLQGIKALITKLKRYKLTRILVEATGGYERQVVEACGEAGLPALIVTPIKIRQFARAQGILAKTDKIDARLIAQFGVVIQPDVRQLPSKNTRKVKDLIARKRQLMEARTQELNRLQKAQKHITGSHRRLLKVLDKEIDWVNDHLAKEVSLIKEWQRVYEILISVPGVGDGVAFTLLGELPELGRLSHR